MAEKYPNFNNKNKVSKRRHKLNENRNKKINSKTLTEILTREYGELIQNHEMQKKKQKKKTTN